jgi:hypothetical protein
MGPPAGVGRERRGDPTDPMSLARAEQSDWLGDRAGLQASYGNQASILWEQGRKDEARCHGNATSASAIWATGAELS